MRKLVIAIDGPAGAGKTTIAKALAEKLDIPFFSTGTMYRALALKCFRLGLDPKSEDVAKLIADNTLVEVKYSNGTQHVILDGEDVTNMLYTDRISLYASEIAPHKVIRNKMIDIQRAVAETQSVIMDGRDIGSVVLPMADFKFYLDADVTVRAKRRYDELTKKGQQITFKDVLADMRDRDLKDKSRKVSPLAVSNNAIVVDATNLSISEVVKEFLKYIGEV